MVQFDFQGKRVLVTGGSQGIGLGIANGFADAGADVLITGTRERPTDYENDLSRFTYVRARLGMQEDRAALVAAAGYTTYWSTMPGMAAPTNIRWRAIRTSSTSI